MDVDLMAKASEFLEDEEGRKRIPYLDTTGHLTVGVGHNLDDTRSIPEGVVNEVLRTATWTDKAVQMLFEHDMATAYKHATIIMGDDKFKTLSDNRKCVIISMAFNLGYTGISKFTKFLGAMGRGDYVTAAAELLDSKAARQLPARYGRMSQMVLNG